MVDLNERAHKLYFKMAAWTQVDGTDKASLSAADAKALRDYAASQNGFDSNQIFVKKIAGKNEFGLVRSAVAGFMDDSDKHCFQNNGDIYVSKAAHDAVVTDGHSMGFRPHRVR